jgi:hypothetical protein
MPRHNATKDDGLLLISQRQYMVGVRLLEGMSVADAAREVGIGRQAIFEWLANDARFQRWLNVQRVGLWRLHRRRLEGLVSAALDVVALRLAAGDAGDAWKVLGACGLLEATPPRVGPLSAIDAMLAGPPSGPVDEHIEASLETAQAERLVLQAVANVKARQEHAENGHVAPR